MIPKLDGISLARSIRSKEKTVPILFLSARNLPTDKIEGFKIGADDYVTKPFSLEELLWRIKAIIRRSGGLHEPQARTEYWGDQWSFKRTERLFICDGSQFKMNNKEAAILHLLLENKNEVVTRSSILISIWGKNDYYSSNSLDVYLSRLRKVIK